MKKHYYQGKAFWRVKGLIEGNCDGCHFHTNHVEYGNACPNDQEPRRHASCFDSDENDDGTEVVVVHTDEIWIPATKKGMAAYVALKLGAADDDSVE